MEYDESSQRIPLAQENNVPEVPQARPIESEADRDGGNKTAGRASNNLTTAFGYGYAASSAFGSSGNAYSSPFGSSADDSYPDSSYFDDAREPLKNGGAPTSNYGEGHYRDKAFAITFLIQFVFVFLCAIVFGARNLGHLRFTISGSHQGLTLLGIFSLTALCGAVASMVWIAVMERYGAFLIRGVFSGTILALLLSGFLCLFSAGTGGIVLALGFFLAAGVFFLYYSSVKQRIPFAAANMRSACSAIGRFPGAVYLAFAGLLLQFLWVTIWAAAVLGVRAEIVGQGDGNPYLRADIVTLALFISLYWGLQTIKNVVHCSVAGVIGEWWYNVAPTKAVSGSLQRALTTSFGSVCLGSLVVAVMKALHSFLSIGKRKRGSTMRWVIIILRYLERTMEYYNKFAYCQVALYGKSFKEAGADTMMLFRERGWTTVINSALVSGVLWAGCFLVGAVTGMNGALWSYSAFHCSAEQAASASAGECDTGSLVFWTASVCFFVGFALCSVVSSVIDSAVCTIWVCFAQDPATLQLTNPRDFNDIVDAWQHFHPDVIAASGPAYAVLRP